MLVREIEIKGFMAHDRTTLELPDRGVTVITGVNGSGKSTVIEAVAYALWGKTLRGTPPWRDGEAGLVSVLTDQVETIQKITKKGTKKLVWRRVEETEFLQFDKQTDARKQLAAEVGDFELWRRTHVFSSADAAHFSSATDMQRKQLIESVLGMEVFDHALVKCREDRHDRLDNLQQVQLEHATLSGQHNAIVHLLDNWLDVVPFEPESEPEQPCEPVDPAVSAELRDEDEELRQARAEAGARTMGRIPEAIVREVTIARQALDVVQQKLSAVESGLCGECERPFKASDKKAARFNVGEASAAYERGLEAEKAVRQKVETDRQTAHNEIAAIDEQMQLIRGDLQRVAEHETLHARWERDHAAWELRQDQRRQRHKGEAATRERDKQRQQTAQQELSDQLDELDVLKKDLETELLELKAVDKVLGMRGVRVQVLAHALTGIEYVANGWLNRMAPGVSLELKPYTETKTAGVNEQLSLVVKGVGGGYGYKAASGGERRRIDAALILGLAEIAAAAEGRQSDGTLWLDECFDALDEAGRAAVAECLTELGKTRSVVIITHMEDLAMSIPAIQRFRAVDGFLHEV